MKHRLLHSLKVVAVVACSLLAQACQFNVENVDKQVCGDMRFAETIVLQLDSVLNSQIVDFCSVGDSIYIMTDGVSIYKIDHSGAVLMSVNKQGHGKEEYLRIGKLFASNDCLYAWCEMSLRLYKYDLDLNFIERFQGPNFGVRKIHVSKNDTAYFLLAGGSDEAIGILPLRQNAQPSYYDCYTTEDKALIINTASGGVTEYKNEIKYVKPSEMQIFTVGKNVVWLYRDDDFSVSPIKEDIASLMPDKMVDFILSNSTCTGLYADDDSLWLITETGSFSIGVENKPAYDKRFLNLFKIDEGGAVVCAYMFNYPEYVYKYMICNDTMHLLLNDGEHYKIARCAL